MDNRKPVLFSYCIPVDDGAAPNPYSGICTLTICKPVIRRTAEIGDWIIGTGSKNSPIGDISKNVVYIMEVTDKKSLQDYDKFCLEQYPSKIPDWDNVDFRIRLGDCLYDYSTNPPTQRKGVHDEDNIKRDLGGEYSLISNHFYYFGDNPIDLPKELYPIIKEGQAHKSKSNEKYFEEFIEWVSNLKFEPNILHGKPQIDLFKKPGTIKTCARVRCVEADEDERESVNREC